MGKYRNILALVKSEIFCILAFTCWSIWLNYLKHPLNNYILNVFAVINLEANTLSCKCQIMITCNLRLGYLHVWPASSRWIFYAENSLNSYFSGYMDAECFFFIITFCQHWTMSVFFWHVLMFTKSQEREPGTRIWWGEAEPQRTLSDVKTCSDNNAARKHFYNIDICDTACGYCVEFIICLTRYWHMGHSHCCGERGWWGGAACSTHRICQGLLCTSKNLY